MKPTRNKQWLSFIFIVICIWQLACDEGIDIWQEIHEPVQVTDLTDDAWKTLRVVREYRKHEQHSDTLEERQKAFYNRYVDAAGIPIIGNDETIDSHFISARQVVLIMTAKHPYLLQHLQDAFYVVVVGGYSEPFERHGSMVFQVYEFPPYLNHIPEFFGSDYGTWAGTFLVGPVPPHRGDFRGFVVGRAVQIREYSMRTIMHEFAHALDVLIPLHHPEYATKLTAIYHNAKATGLWTDKLPERALRYKPGTFNFANLGIENPIAHDYDFEFLPEMLEIYYFGIGSGPTMQFDSLDAFIEYDPMTAEFIMEWFEYAPMQELFFVETVIARDQTTQ